MANNVSTGFRLVDTISGASHNAKVMRCWVGSGDSTAIFVGDLVSVNNASGHGVDPVTGYLEVKQSAAADISQNTIGVVLGVNPILGVAVGSENLNRVYRPASTAMYLDVCVDPDAIYTLQSDGTVAITDVGKYSVIAVGTGSTVTGISGMTLHEAGLTTTRTSGQVQIIGQDSSVDNAQSSANTTLRVRIVNSFFTT